MSDNATYISLISNPQFWATIRAIHNHMTMGKLGDWGYKDINRLGEIIEGKYSDHLTAQHKQDEINFMNKLAAFIRQQTSSQTSVGTITDIEHLTYILKLQDQSVLTPAEKEFVDAFDTFIQQRINAAVSNTVNNLKIVKEQ